MDGVGMDNEKYFIENFDKALSENWIIVYYQPIFRIITKKICATESLAYWNDPEKGIIPPEVFVPYLEKHHLVHKLDLYMCEKIIEDLHKAIKEGIQCVPTSLNVDAADFEEDNFVESIIEMVGKYGIPRKLLTIEIRDSFNEQFEIQKREYISDLKTQGCNVWLDDFGRHYTSLDGLKKYPYSVVKFDAGFFNDVYGADGEERARIIFSYTVNMAKCMKVGTLIDKVVSEDQFGFFKRLGFEMAEGPYFAKPVPSEELLKLPFERESVDEEPYYRSIGQIEMDNTLLKSGSFWTSSSESMSIVEYVDHTYSFIYLNESSKIYLRNLGLNKNLVEKLFNQRSGMLQENLHSFVTQLSHGARGVRLFFLLQEKIVDLRGDFIARNPKSGAIAFVLYTHPSSDGSRNRIRDFHRSMEGIYSIFDRFDLIDAKTGRIENTFLNTYKYGGIHTGLGFKETIEEYANQYIVKKERERFIDFMDISTFVERLEENGFRFFTEVFSTIMDDGHICEKRYLLSRINSDENEMILLAIIRIDEGGKPQNNQS